MIPAKTVLLVEDDERLGPIIRDVLSSDWEVTLVPDAERAEASTRARIFDVIVVDRRLPGTDGLSLVRRLREAGVRTPMLMLTALDRASDIVGGLDAGANDYLTKPFDFEVLKARLRSLTRDYHSRGEGIEIGSWTFYPHCDTIEWRYGRIVQLTPTESRLLQVLASQPHHPVTRHHLLTAAFSKQANVGTVDTYVHYVREKTDRRLVLTIRGTGYKLGHPD